jgi:transglutaminase superfamily protein
MSRSSKTTSAGCFRNPVGSICGRIFRAKCCLSAAQPILSIGQVHALRAARVRGRRRHVARIMAMLEWIHRNVDYVADVSNAETTAERTFVDRAGVCRDFTHLGITFARALGIPARAVSAYALQLDPLDFHAIFEVYIENDWWLIDRQGSRPSKVSCASEVDATPRISPSLRRTSSARQFDRRSRFRRHSGTQMQEADERTIASTLRSRSCRPASSGTSWRPLNGYLVC